MDASNYTPSRLRLDVSSLLCLERRERTLILVLGYPVRLAEETETEHLTSRDTIDCGQW